MAKAAAARGTRADYARLQSIRTRWMDNDVYGHVNNVVYYSFFDTAVNSALIEQGLLDPATSPVIALVVETGCSYFEAVSFPETITVGLRVGRLGSSSIRYEMAIFGEGAEQAAAEGHFIHVCVDSETRRPVAIPAAMRAFLESLIVPVPAGDAA